MAHKLEETLKKQQKYEKYRILQYCIFVNMEEIWHFMSILLLRNCKNRCIFGNAILLSSLNLHTQIICINFALGNKCKIYESDRYITMSQQKGENEPYLVV